MIDGSRVLVTGGTGSLGQALVRRLLAMEHGPEHVTVLSRDEAKQHDMRLALRGRDTATDEVLFRDAEQRVGFQIGSVTDPNAVRRALDGVDLVVHAAALKQVPTCEYFPLEAVRTNVEGAAVLASVIARERIPVRAVVGVSTDKACKPVNVMGMTKALQERVLVEANLQSVDTRFVLARYGNVMGSRGSVIPLFRDQVRRGGPVTVTTPEMTRFSMSLDQAVDTVLAALVGAAPGETYIPLVPSARVIDIARAVIGERRIPIEVVGVRPGEKIHEVLVSEEESARTVRRDGHLVVRPMLPELLGACDDEPYGGIEYSSADDVIDLGSTTSLLADDGHLVGL